MHFTSGQKKWHLIQYNNTQMHIFAELYFSIHIAANVHKVFDKSNIMNTFVCTCIARIWVFPIPARFHIRVRRWANEFHIFDILEKHIRSSSNTMRIRKQ